MPLKGRTALRFSTQTLLLQLGVVAWWCSSAGPSMPG